MKSPNGDRSAILGRIKEALQVTAPLHHPAERSAGNEPTTAQFRRWLPPVGSNAEARLDLFTKQSELLRSELILCNDLDSAARELTKLAEAGEWKTIGLHKGELSSALEARLPGELGRIFVDDGYDKNALEAADAGLTECELLVAQTGSVCVTGPSSGGRVLSVLPPHHVVVARRSQIVTDLTEAYASLAAKYRGQYPSMISFITGPSRTGDIERILVLGAHGPKRLTILLLPN